VPGPPTICCVFVFGADNHPDELGSPPDDPEDSDWQPFDFLMWRWGGEGAVSVVNSAPKQCKPSTKCVAPLWLEGWFLLPILSWQQLGWWLSTDARGAC
jgi:hypothetical protein